MLQAIITGIISAYMVSLLAVAYWAAWLIPDRRRRNRFFGVGRHQRKVHILSSFLQIQPGGAHGTEALRVGFTGPAMIRSEYLGAQRLRSCLETVARRGGPNIAMDRLHRLVVRIDASPSQMGLPEQYEVGTLVLLGSRVYNRLTTKYFDENDEAFFNWVKAPNNERTFAPSRYVDGDIPYRRTPGTGEDPTRISTTQLAVIERHRDQEFDRWVFVLAGVGALATTGAAKYLADNWRLLERKIAKGRLAPEFAVLLEFSPCLPDLDIVQSLADIPEPVVLRLTDKTMYARPSNGVLTT